MNEMRRVLVTGANRGLGLEFVRQLLERGDRVFAGCREPDDADELRACGATAPGRLTLVRLDVTDEESIRAAAATVADETDALDWVINNAGTFATGEAGLFHLDAAKMTHVFQVNAIGPAIVGKHFAPLLRHGDRPLLANLTSGVGLLTDREGSPGEQYSYRASKAALNQIIRSLSFDFKPLGVTVVGIGPGFVLTDMTRGSRATPPLLPPESVAGMLAVLDALTPEQTGRFFGWHGGEDDWMRREG
jgi:NAD(P)-dependent dehydrogenase (short-subunit alcohol dehydrogenase family)